LLPNYCNEFQLGPPVKDVSFAHRFCCRLGRRTRAESRPPGTPFPPGGQIFCRSPFTL